MKNEKVMQDLEDKGRLAFRAKKGDVPLAIMSILSQSPSNGYEIVKKIEERSQGFWKVSSGSVYPALESLEYDSLVVSDFDDSEIFRKQIFKLTSAGVKKIQLQNTRVHELWSLFQAPPAMVGRQQIDTEIEKFLEAIALVRKNRPDLIAQISERILPEATKSLYTFLTK